MNDSKRKKIRLYNLLFALGCGGILLFLWLAPPVRTPRGWLTTFHAVRVVERNLPNWEREWHKEYLAGIMLLDLADPSKVLGISRAPLLAPEAPYETSGYRGSVIFPGGMVLEDSGEVKIWYGAADTVECLATADVDELLAVCEPTSGA